MPGRAFSDFTEISPATQSILAAQGFTNATPVQEATIPLFCGNKDVAVDACTGSGKTLAFIIPVVERLRRLDSPLKKYQIGALILSPTRELSRQIYSVAEPFIASVPWLTSTLLVGGSDPAADVAALKSTGAHILVGTPGRIDDLLQRCPFLDLKSVEVLVLDEADRLLDMGFKLQLDSIIKRLPRQRRTGLFSATQTEAVQALARAGLRNPVRVNVAVTMAAADDTTVARKQKKKKRKTTSDSSDSDDGTSSEDDDDDDDGDEEEDRMVNGKRKKTDTTTPAPGYVQVTPSTLTVQYTLCATKNKLPQLIKFLQQHRDEKVIVYFLTCACVDYFSMVLPLICTELKNLPSSSVSYNSNSSGSGSNKNNKTADTTGSSSSQLLLALHGKMKQAARESTLSSFAACSAGVLLATDVAARGLDIPDVNWVVQYDAPQDPAAFVHRCGRTARMGRMGQALVYLTLEESTYVDFLNVRKVPLTEIPCIGDSGGSSKKKGVFEVLRKASESNRAVMESGTKAFVSYIRAYKEHHCRFIFRIEDLALGALASSFALLRLPGMPEIKKAARKEGGITDFEPSTVDIDSIRFKEKAREKQRQVALKTRQAKHDVEKEERKKRKAQQLQQQQVTQQQRLTATKRRQLEARQQVDDLTDEYALLRKLKKGKITQKQYDVATGLSSDSDVDELDDAVVVAGKDGSKGGGEGKERNGTGEGDTDSDDDDGSGKQQKQQQGVVGTTTVSSIKNNNSIGGKQRGSQVLSRDYVATALLKKAKKKKKKAAKKKAAAEKYTGGGD